MEVLSLFHPLVREWFLGRFAAPTVIQEKAWEAIAGGSHTLITAPTGSGKTLAAFLWAIDGLVSGRTPGGGIRVLYLSPLKALNNDIRKNLTRPLEELQSLFRDRGESFPAIRVQTRSGDTPENERRALRTRPPEILITTPESLNILLTTPQAAGFFSRVAVVILDEIHAVLESKRGTHLIAGVERLTRYSGEFQRVSLSATVKPLSVVAEFVGGRLPSGRPRPVVIVEDTSKKNYAISVTAPFLADDPAGGESGWGPLVALCREVIDRNRSTLFFASSRKKTEKLSRLINETSPEILAYSHHGALSREIRLAVEDQLKSGRLKAIVATGTLELGIDVGELDEVVLVQSSASVHQAVQRVGRAGHQVSGTSRGLLIPLGGVDLVHLGALARAVTGHDIETIRPPESPLDVLAQIILSMTAAETWKTDDLYRFLRTMYPYRNLERVHFDQVLGLLAGRYEETNIRELKPRVVLDAVDGTVAARKGARFLVYTAGGTIPDRGYYELRSADSGARLGDLDEEFVWERNIGDTFVFGPSTWRIQRITHNTVEVTSQSGTMAMAPFYRAEEQNRSFHFSARIGEFLETAHELLPDEDAFRERMKADFHFSDEACAALRRLLVSQVESTKTGLPHRRHIVIEHCQVPMSEGQIGIVLIHTFWGGRVNKPLADAFALLWEDRFHYPLEHYANNDCLLFHVPHEFSAGLFREILGSERLIPALLAHITRSNAFGALFRENSGRALLLPRARPNRRMPFWLTRLRAKNLLAAVLRFPEFPLVTETARNLVEGYFDLKSLQLVIDEIGSGAIGLSETVTGHPSPFAAEIVWRMTNQYMYENDELKARDLRPWQTEERLLFDPRLLAEVPAALVAELERKLQRLQPGYAPRDTEELFLHLQERLAIPAPEWQGLADAAERDGVESFAAVLAPKKDRILSVLPPRSRIRLVVLLENIPSLCRALALEPDALQAQTLDGDPFPETRFREVLSKLKPGSDGERESGTPEELLADYLEQFLRFYGPIQEAMLADLFGVEERLLQAAINELLEEEKSVYGRLLERDTRLSLCDRENYGRLLALKRRARRREGPLLDIGDLPLWLAARQHLIERTSGPEALPQALEKLLGWPAPVQAWEEYLLPSRMASYDPAALDSLLSRTDLVWTGAGKKKIHFFFPEDRSLLQGKERSSPVACAALFPHARGRYTLEDLVLHTGRAPAEVQDELWRCVWGGNVSNTSFETLRQAMALDFSFAAEKGRAGSRPRPNPKSRWTPRLASAGYWSLLPDAGGETEADDDPVDALETNKERVRLLLDRYGCLFRELLVHEPPAFQWKSLFPALRVMELSGEIVGGSFFKDVPGLQFMAEDAPAAAGRLPGERRVYWMNAQDPASPCGKPLAALKGLFPDRLASNWLVFQGPRLALTLRKNGAELEFGVEADHPDIGTFGEIFSFLVSRSADPLKSVKTVLVNGRDALQSPFRPVLAGWGFREEYKSLVFRKNY